MNLYAKKWKESECDPELRDVFGIRFYQHAEKVLYKAWSLNFILAKKGIFELTFTTNHSAYFEKYKRDWEYESNWQALGDRKS